MNANFGFWISDFGLRVCAQRSWRRARNPKSKIQNPKSLRRHGLTLLETILAMAILGMSMAVVGELIRVGARHAQAARDLTTAQILCESILNEIAAGVLRPDAVDGEPCEFDDEWVYSVTPSTVEQEGVIAVEVSVSRADDPSRRPITCTLVRWIVDPEATAAADAASEEAATSSAGGAS